MSYEMKGFSFAFGTRKGDLMTEKALDSLKKLRATGTEWIALCVDQRIATHRSTTIRFDYNFNVTDLELIHMIGTAHELGMKVCLKPMINCDDHEWRARVDFMYDQGNWDKWFYEYKGYILHMAEIAEYTGCEMLCLGCEMLGMERQEAHWRDLIAKTRQVYNGPLTYNTNHGKEHVAKWYDALDYIGTSAYFPVATEGGASVQEMAAEWEKVKEKMQAIHEKFDKPIIFMEIGCRSAKGAATMPWDFMHRELPYSEEEQANFYESCLLTFRDTPWFKGFFWWDWSIHLPEEGREDRGFAIYGKKAEEVLRKYYK